MSPDPKGIWITRQIEALSGPLEETWDLCDLYVDVREETGPLRFPLAVTPEPSQPSPMGLIPWAPELEVPQIARSVLSFDAGPSPVTPLLETPRWRQGPSNKGSFGCLAPSVPTGPHPLVVSLALSFLGLSPLQAFAPALPLARGSSHRNLSREALPDSQSPRRQMPLLNACVSSKQNLTVLCHHGLSACLSPL